MSKQIGWGVIGAGGIANRRTIPEGMVGARNARLAALMDANPDLKGPLESKYHVPFFTRVEDLLSQPIDAVYIATPTFLHEAQAVAAAEAGKHVLCEKPLALDLASGRRIAAACAASGVKLGLGYMMRFNAAHQEIQRMIARGDLGTPVMARAQITCWFPPMPGNWRQIREKGGGGSLADMAVHGLDLLDYLLGPITEVTAQTGTVVQRYEDPSVEDSVVLMLRFKNGGMGVVDAHFNVPDEAGEYMLEVYGSNGAAKTRFTVCQQSAGELRVFLSKQPKGYEAAQVSGGGGYRTVDLEKSPNIYRAQIEAFSGAILSGGEPPVGSAVGFRSLELMEAAYRSARTGQRVMLP
ncbi:MAG: Gfo/Idh/MocA family protein [Verrucomicrobiia bacterium]